MSGSIRNYLYFFKNTKIVFFRGFNFLENNCFIQPITPARKASPELSTKSIPYVRVRAVDISCTVRATLRSTAHANVDFVIFLRTISRIQKLPETFM